MTAATFVSRRTTLLGMGATLGTGLVPGRASANGEQQGLAATAASVNPRLVSRALDALAQHNSQIWSRDVIAIADFGLPSAVPRFHLIDILRGSTTSLLVAHGRGSDPANTGMLQNFSDVDGSACTSEGAYVTGQMYSGVHGLSRRVTGLDPTNGHAEDRAIVIHSASYVDPAIAAQYGKIGRSDGCFAFAERDIPFVLAKLGEGRLLYAGKT
jgi:hypothetical protein